jgi:hypothetical protein
MEHLDATIEYDPIWIYCGLWRWFLQSLVYKKIRMWSLETNL